MSESDYRSGASDVFTVSFNVALAAHLQGIQDSIDGDMDAAQQSFVIAFKMYNLTLQQSSQGNEDPPVNTRNDLIFAAIFNNLAHVYAALDEDDYSVAAANQLLKALFFLVDSGRITSSQEVETHDAFMKNACLLTMDTRAIAAAA